MVYRPTRLTVEFVREKFAEADIELLETEYSKCSIPLLCICKKCQKEFKRTWANFKQSGTGCPDCGYRRRPQSQLLHTHEEVNKLFELYKCKLFSQYRVKSDSLEYKCSCGNISKTRLRSFIKSKGTCPKCAKRAEKNPMWNSDREEAKLRKFFRNKCQVLVRNVLKSTGKKKTARTNYILGYSGEDLRKHIESFPEWVDLKSQNWHLDHIFPVKAFLDFGIDDMKMINCLENLRPISSRANLQKQGKYDAKSFLKWIFIAELCAI